MLCMPGEAAVSDTAVSDSSACRAFNRKAGGKSTKARHIGGTDASCVVRNAVGVMSASREFKWGRNVSARLTTDQNCRSSTVDRFSRVNPTESVSLGLQKRRNYL
jgi:hypothetical protein